MKRIETDLWTVQTGLVTGHYHSDAQSNRQDAFALSVTDNQICAVVCDGCGGSPYSEVGAHLLSRFIVKQVRDLFRRGVSAKDIPDYIFFPTIEYIRHQMHLNCDSYNTSDGVQMINDYWLATVVGFVIDQNWVICFSAGDGYHQRNEKKITRLGGSDFSAPPSYLAYAAIRDPDEVGILEKYVPKKFEKVEFFIQDVKKFAVMTDGFTTKRSNCKEDDIELEWGLKGKIGLQLWMNRKRSAGHFNDDCAIITCERK